MVAATVVVVDGDRAFIVVEEERGSVFLVALHRRRSSCSSGTERAREPQLRHDSLRTVRRQLFPVPPPNFLLLLIPCRPPEKQEEGNREFKGIFSGRRLFVFFQISVSVLSRRV
ncbi:unnamed protein product [Linum trigynum]|uniref:Uncharacterized protein n=1 Tax=Linum trigynum TaxID=586398 RepID=A0AAV2CVT6_9ROSI